MTGRRRRSAEPDTLPAPPKAWSGRELAVLLGGPIDPETGRWFFVDDLEQLARAEAQSPRGWPYRRTDRHLAHPNYYATGVVHERMTHAELVRAAGIERDLGIARTERSNPAALDEAVRIIRATARHTPEFSANATRSAMDAAGIAGPIVGAAYRRAAQSVPPLIEPTGRREPSTQRATHAHRIEVYRSLICERVSA